MTRWDAGEAAVREGQDRDVGDLRERDRGEVYFQNLDGQDRGEGNEKEQPYQYGAHASCRGAGRSQRQQARFR